MSNISVLAQYPEEGLTILEDDKGRFAMTKDSESIEEVYEPPVVTYSHGFVRDLFAKPPQSRHYALN